MIHAISRDRSKDLTTMSEAIHARLAVWKCHVEAAKGILAFYPPLKKLNGGEPDSDVFNATPHDIRQGAIPH